MDKLTIRLEAVKLAVMCRTENGNIINTAKVIEDYIIGSAQVNEYVDNNQVLREMMSSLNALSNDWKERNGVILEKCLCPDSEHVFLQKDDEKVE